MHPIPSSVLTMGLRPFDWCGALESIYFKGTPPRVISGFYLGPDANTCVAYYLPSMKQKWSASFGGIPTAVRSF